MLQLFFIPALSSSAYIFVLFRRATNPEDLYGKVAMIVVITNTISLGIAFMFVTAITAVLLPSPGMLENATWRTPPVAFIVNAIFGVLICVNIALFIRDFLGVGEK